MTKYAERHLTGEIEELVSNAIMEFNKAKL